LTIGFSTKALRTLSESKTLASRKFGNAVGDALRARLADAWAARNVEELPLWFTTTEGEAARFFLPIAEGFVAVFESNHAVDREAKAGTPIHWRQVTRIKLLEVKFDG
jgi:hypothetical protein